MLIIQADQKLYANQHCGLAPLYKIEDLVWLDIRNLFTKRPSKKLENCHVGKYQVKMMISNHVIELDLLSDFHVHFISHVNLFESTATDDTYCGHVKPLGLPIKVDGETKYKVTAIVDICLFMKTKKLQYCVK